MASRLANRQIELNAQLRKKSADGIERIWRALPEYRDETLPAWLSAAVPLVQAAQRAQISLTDAYVARSLDRPVIGLDAKKLLDGYRNGASYDDVYSRPFGEVWEALAAGATFSEAQERGRARAAQTIVTDVQLAMRDAAMLAQQEYGIFGYQRVADGDACDFCQEVDGAYVKGPDFVMDLHPGCGCGLEPVENEPLNATVYLPDGTQVRPYAYGPLNDKVAVYKHGELGSVLGDPNHDFTELPRAQVPA
jgi:hypothetical protein